ncbi:unnamed protein product [Pseudo-nitzschia multistriata]|uniref:Uncharacterized protein n=1 Tax=Pseudo-nitzschia multistriata TaxID=183589 RepID=A0A448ZQ90_9STRA|nr:unnamed protein product [Pseudo-nitzschia multistriata]
MVIKLLNPSTKNDAAFSDVPSVALVGGWMDGLALSRWYSSASVSPILRLQGGNDGVLLLVLQVLRRLPGKQEAVVGFLEVRVSPGRHDRQRLRLAVDPDDLGDRPAAVAGPQAKGVAARVEHQDLVALLEAGHHDVLLEVVSGKAEGTSNVGEFLGPVGGLADRQKVHPAVLAGVDVPQEHVGTQVYVGHPRLLALKRVFDLAVGVPTVEIGPLAKLGDQLHLVKEGRGGFFELVDVVLHPREVGSVVRVLVPEDFRAEAPANVHTDDAAVDALGLEHGVRFHSKFDDALDGTDGDLEVLHGGSRVDVELRDGVLGNGVHDVLLAADGRAELGLVAADLEDLRRARVDQGVDPQSDHEIGVFRDALQLLEGVDVQKNAVELRVLVTDANLVLGLDGGATSCRRMAGWGFVLTAMACRALGWSPNTSMRWVRYFRWVVQEWNIRAVSSGPTMSRSLACSRAQKASSLVGKTLLFVTDDMARCEIRWLLRTKGEGGARRFETRVSRVRFEGDGDGKEAKADSARELWLRLRLRLLLLLINADDLAVNSLLNIIGGFGDIGGKTGLSENGLLLVGGWDRRLLFAVVCFDFCAEWLCSARIRSS